MYLHSAIVLVDNKSTRKGKWKNKMVNTVLLRTKVKDSGLKYKYVAKEMDISAYALQLKIDGENEFLVSEVESLCKVLGLTNKEKDDIFFASCVDYKSTK